MMSKTAMKLALEALENAEYGDYDKKELNEAITALQKALAQELRSDEQPAHEQEPYPFEEMQEEILRLSKIISTNAFYQAGHANALEWAEEMAVLEDPRTSDWVYDDPHELAKALRKGPDFWPTTQPAQQEPVAWQYRDARDDGTWGAWIGCDKRLAEDEYRQVRALYASPQPAPVQQEPVAIVSGYYGGQCVILPIDPARIFNSNTALYTSPAQRKPLTDEQIMAIGKELGLKCRLGGNPNIDFDYARAIEAAHGIKENT
jgi:hypothetical protein